MTKRLIDRAKTLIKEQDDVIDLAKGGNESAYDNYDEGSWVSDALQLLRDIVKDSKK
ncbi:MAG: hypothetical protein RSA09_00245 [Acinetobacter sp.]